MCVAQKGREEGVACKVSEETETNLPSAYKSGAHPLSIQSLQPGNSPPTPTPDPHATTQWTTTQSTCPTSRPTNS
jgi:hypothetical protein